MKCKSCKSEFTPMYRNEVLMSKLCVPCLISKGKKKREAQSRVETKALKEKLKTHSQWLNELQKVFNTYIRVRDKGLPCISCGTAIVNKFDAGHYFSVGAYPNLRFNTDNVHAQCVACNQHRHGNSNEYAIGLVKRIGQERFDLLLEDRNKPLKLTTTEIKELIEIYKQKIKNYQNGND